MVSVKDMRAELNKDVWYMIVLPGLVELNCDFYDMNVKNVKKRLALYYRSMLIRQRNNTNSRYFDVIENNIRKYRSSFEFISRWIEEKGL